MNELLELAAQEGWAASWEGQRVVFTRAGSFPMIAQGRSHLTYLQCGIYKITKERKLWAREHLLAAKGH